MEVFQLRPSGAQCLPLVSYGIRVTCLVSCVRSKQDLVICISTCHQRRLSFLELTYKLFWDIRISVSNPTFSCLAFEFLFSLTSSEGKLGQGVREKVNSFCIVEISLSPTFQFYFADGLGSNLGS